MYAPFFAKHSFNMGIITVLALSLGMAHSVTAIPITPTITGGFTRPENFSKPFQVAIGDFSVPDFTWSLHAPNSGFATEGMLSTALPLELQGISVHVATITVEDEFNVFRSDGYPRNFLMNDIICPMSGHGDALFPSGQSPAYPDIPIPEPSTLVLLITAFGGMYGYGLWRQK